MLCCEPCWGSDQALKAESKNKVVIEEADIQIETTVHQSRVELAITTYFEL